MTPAAIIRAAAADGVRLALSPSGGIKATGDQAAVNRWLPVLRENKSALIEALAHPDPLWWRTRILEPGGRAIEVDTPSGFTLPDWEAYAERYHGLGCVVAPLAGLPTKPCAPVPLGEALAAACEGLAGITPAVFRSLLSPEDIKDILTGAIPAVPTLRAYAQSFAERVASGRVVVPGGAP